MVTIRICDRCGARIDLESTSIFINGIWHVGYKQSHFAYDLCPSCLEKAIAVCQTYLRGEKVNDR